MKRGVHTKPNDGDSVEWLTPPDLQKSLGIFDLDPCAHPKQFYRTARTMISPPADGLSLKWRGRVWLNPPYGAALKKWMGRMAEHGHGIAIVPSRTEVESWFWPFVWEAAQAVFFLRGRLYFHRPDGSTAGNAGHGSVLAAYSVADVREIELSGLSGRLVMQHDVRNTDGNLLPLHGNGAAQ